MTEINSLFPLPSARPVDGPLRKPEDRNHQHERAPKQPHEAHNQSSQRTKKAPLNLHPSDEALTRLVGRAQDYQNQGQSLERGAILNLVI